MSKIYLETIIFVDELSLEEFFFYVDRFNLTYSLVQTFRGRCRLRALSRDNGTVYFTRSYRNYYTLKHAIANFRVSNFYFL